MIEIIEFISQKSENIRPKSIPKLINCVIKYLAENRCLLILDNVESILCNESRVGKYKHDCQLYEQLFKVIAEQNHQSCLLLTSRETIVQLELQETKVSLVKSLQLLGLSNIAANSILHHQGITESPILIDKYAGNPLALKIASTTIKSVFRGGVSQFLAQEVTIYGDIWDLLSEQFNRLTEIEQSIMYWLAVNRKSLTFSELQNDIFPKIRFRQIITAIESLKRRSLIEVSNIGFTQQAAIAEYITELMLEPAEQQIIPDK